VSCNRRLEPALVVILAGVSAALHVGKLPPAITTLQQALGLSLVQAGFLLSLVQLAGMSAGVAFGGVADMLGLRRSMATGLFVLAAVSAAGGAVQQVGLLMLLRACEGFGFLLVVLPAPGLVRHLVEPQRMAAMMGVWGAYMPLATALALLVGPLWIGALGWRAWWWLLSAVSLCMALWLLRAVPPRPAAVAQAVTSVSWSQRLRLTLAAPSAWLVALCFSMYSGQWLAVVGFLPTIYAQAGVGQAATGVLTALAAAVNMAGNVLAGRFLQRGVAPTRLLTVGYATMAVAATAAFAGDAGGLPPALRYVAVLVFSAVGGMIPGTLFALSPRAAPSEQTLSTTVGWMQQWSAFGQFGGPPLVAWVASRAGGWHWTWVATGGCCVVGLALTAAIQRWLTRHPARALATGLR